MKLSLIHFSLLACLFSGTALAQVQVGNNANATALETTAVGDNAHAVTDLSTAIGARALADGGTVDGNPCVGAIAVGNEAEARGCSTTSLGHMSQANGPSATAVGARAQSTGVNSSAFGAGASASNSGTAIGSNTSVSGTFGAAIGSGASAAGSRGTAVGAMAKADADGCVALGSSSECTASDEVSVGNAGYGISRRVTNLANGMNDTDAASVGQLRTMATAIGGGASFVNGVFVQPTITLSSGNTHNNVTAAIYDLDGRLHSLEQNPGGGSQGPAGPTGASAYQVAVNNGFNGTQQEWLDSLKGDKGDPGEPGTPGSGGDGPQGPAGANGDSAYEVAVQEGFNGTREEWLESLQGANGHDGVNGEGRELRAGSNVEVTTNADGSQTASLSDSVVLSEKGSLTVGATTVNNSGLTIKGGPSVTANGIDAGGQRVTGVSDGRVAQGSTDAVNGGQLWNLQQSLDDRWIEIDRRMDRTDKRINGLGAQTAAMSQMAAAGGPYGLAVGEVAVNAGVGFYGNEAAIAVGWSTRLTERVNVSAGLSFGSGSTKPMGGVGVSIRLGR